MVGMKVSKWQLHTKELCGYTLINKQNYSHFCTPHISSLKMHTHASRTWNKKIKSKNVMQSERKRNGSNGERDTANPNAGATTNYKT